MLPKRYLDRAMLSILNRMVWNTRYWQKPTFASVDGGFPSESGYGHEEWNFQTEDAVDGFVYGYLYYRPPEYRLSETFHITFFSVEPHSRRNLIVGVYGRAVPTTEQDAARADSEFERRRIYERRATELSEVSGGRVKYADALAEIRQSVRERWMAFRCPVKHVQLLDTPVDVDAIVKRKVSMHFTKPTFIDGFDTSISALRDQAKSRNNRTLFEDSYFRETPESRKLIRRKHSKLSNQFVAWLRTKGCQNILQEDDAVDIQFQFRGHHYLAELKITYAAPASKSIREALGQLLEYNFYPRRIAFQKWMIVIDREPSSDDLAFAETLRKRCNFPLCICWPIKAGFEVRPSF
jgi:hypothetical protein